MTDPRRHPERMRASDADRDRVAERLREALAEGRLTVEEHAERLYAVYRARAYAEPSPPNAILWITQSPRGLSGWHTRQGV